MFFILILAVGKGTRTRPDWTGFLLGAAGRIWFICFPKEANRGVAAIELAAVGSLPTGLLHWTVQIWPLSKQNPKAGWLRGFVGAASQI